MADRIGFIGLGTMGRPLATNLIHDGFPLTVYDARPEAMRELEQLGAQGAQSPREVATSSDIIEIAIAPSAQIEVAVLGPDGIVEAAAPGLVVVIHSTIQPSNIQQIAEQARSAGVEILDAQMSGGEQGVRSRTLCFMVGGEASTLERCRPLLSASGSHVFHVGGVGAGAAVKMAQEILTFVTIVSASEAFRVVEHAGIDLQTFQELVRVSAGQSHVADRWLDVWSKRTSPGGIPEILDTALALGRDLDLSLPLAALARQIIPDLFPLDAAAARTRPMS